jgi:large subunit ribosomal protein L10
MPSQRNTQSLEKAKARLKAGKAFYFTDFTGLPVAKLEKLRRELKKNQGEYLVAKNTLGSLALKDFGLTEEKAGKFFVGATGIAIAYDDPVVLAKILKDTDNLKIKGGFIEGEYFDAAAVVRLSQIPSRKILLGGVVGSLNIIGNFVYTLESILRSLVYTIEAMKTKEVK